MNAADAIGTNPRQTTRDTTAPAAAAWLIDPQVKPKPQTQAQRWEAEPEHRDPEGDQ
jgi:hypothetical protein